MVSLSVKGKYGVAAVFELAVQEHGTPVQIRQLSTTCNIPQNYLEQILVVLKKEGIAKSFRGAQGGYVLAKPASQISVKDVLFCLEGPSQLAANYCGSSILTQFWCGFDDAISRYLDRTFESLVADKQRLEKTFHFTI